MNNCIVLFYYLDVCYSIYEQEQKRLLSPESNNTCSEKRVEGRNSGCLEFQNPTDTHVACLTNHRPSQKQRIFSTDSFRKRSRPHSPRQESQPANRVRLLRSSIPRWSSSDNACITTKTSFHNGLLPATSDSISSLIHARNAELICVSLHSAQPHPPAT